MKIIFAGTPDFAATALAMIHDAGIEVALVLTQPDRPAGRGMQLHASAVKQFAVAHGIPVAQPVSLRLDGKYPADADAAHALLRATEHDVMVVAAYGLILPPSVLAIPPRGCINIHGSLLPRWRGAAPIHRAIEAGDTETGITLMQMDAGLDTGPLLLTRSCPITPDETTGSLFEKLTLTATGAIVDAIEKLPLLRAVAQPHDGVTYAKKIDKSEARIDWRQAAKDIERRMRAFDPAPGCDSTLADEPLKIWRARVNAVREGTTGVPGTIVDVASDRLTVQCGVGALDLVTVQKPGRKRIAVADFLRGLTIQTGWRFI